MLVQKEAEEHTLGRCGPEPKALGSWLVPLGGRKGHFRRGLQLGEGWTRAEGGKSVGPRH